MRFEITNLLYVVLRANGVQSILYDAVSPLQAVRSEHDRIAVLGVSSALALIRLVSRARVITNTDAIEWKREKLAPLVLRASEWVAVRFSHETIADNASRASVMPQAARNRAGDFTFETYAAQLRRIVDNLRS